VTSAAPASPPARAPPRRPSTPRAAAARHDQSARGARAPGRTLDGGARGSLGGVAGRAGQVSSLPSYKSRPSPRTNRTRLEGVAGPSRGRGGTCLLLHKEEVVDAAGAPEPHSAHSDHGGGVWRGGVRVAKREQERRRVSRGSRPRRRRRVEASQRKRLPRPRTPRVSLFGLVNFSAGRRKSRGVGGAGGVRGAGGAGQRPGRQNPV
jgi:hypothetical protein